MVENGRDHRSGGRFPVASRHRDPILQPHEFRQQLTTRNHRNLQTARLLHFRIRFINRRTDYQSLRPRDILRVVTLVNNRAQFTQTIRRRGQF